MVLPQLGLANVGQDLVDVGARLKDRVLGTSPRALKVSPFALGRVNFGGVEAATLKAGVNVGCEDKVLLASNKA